MEFVLERTRAATRFVGDGVTKTQETITRRPSNGQGRRLSLESITEWVQGSADRRVKAQERGGVQIFNENTIASIPDAEQNFWD